VNTSPFKIGMGALVLLVPWLTTAQAETARLELKQLADPAGTFRFDRYAIYRMVNHQGLHRLRDNEDSSQRMDKEFAQVVRKEPEKYLCDFPFRGVVKLGSQRFGFVLDSNRLARGYHRLHFDLNGNGDLTDDQVIEAHRGGTVVGGDYASREFPRVDVVIDVDGTKMEYSFFVSVYSYGIEAGKAPRQANVSFAAATYREGQITLDGKSHHLVLLDFNSTGRFDDVFTVDRKHSFLDGQIYPTYGDVLLIDPDTKSPAFGYGLTDRKERVPVSKLVCIDGKYYELKISPTGEELTVVPYQGALAAAVNMNCGQYDAVIYGDGGVLKISGEKNKPGMLPVGEWRLLGYQASPARSPETRPAGTEDPASKPADPPKPHRRSLLARAIRSWLGSGNDEADEDEEEDEEAQAISLRGRQTLASGVGTKDAPPFKVEAGRTAVMKFGPPYKPVVKTQYWGSPSEVYLTLAITGAGGEILDDLLVNGNRPNAPSFQIIAPDGEIILRGKFEFG